MGNAGSIEMGITTIADVAKHAFDYSKDLERRRTIKFEYWAKLRKAKAEFESTHRYVYFEDWMKVNYGLAIDYDISGNITDKFTIIDGPKYTFFLMKYS